MSELLLRDFEPRSMLKVPVTPVERPRYPVIDYHTHLTWIDDSNPDRIKLLGEVAEFLEVMDRRDVRMMVNLTGGYGTAFVEATDVLDRAEPSRFVTFTEPSWPRIMETDYAQTQADEIAKAYRAGARGLKILKVLGLYLQDGPSLLSIDDPRFDPMWEAAGALRMPVTIHSSDPEAFFLPIDRFNERWEDLQVHPEWSFCGCNFPASRELHEARNRVVKRHPKTTFVCAHVACAEDLGYVSECMDEHPNMYVDISARIGELGRQPRAARRFFEHYQDRILFGTDAIPNVPDYPQQVFGDELYRIYYRFLETEDEYFDYSPSATPPQGRWCISGLHLPPAILEKVYWQNAARLLRLPALSVKTLDDARRLP